MSEAIGTQSFGTVQSYWSYTVRALGDMAPAVTAPPGSSADILTPPMRTHVGALIAVAESISDMPIGQLVQLAGNIGALAQAADPYQAMAATMALLKATADITVTVLDAVKAAGAMAEVVPIIGQVIDTALAGLSIGMSFAARQQQWTGACKQALDCYTTRECQRLVNAFVPTPTRSTAKGGVTASDMFRPIRRALVDPQYETYWRPRLGGAPLPMTVASVYVALCGDVVDAPLAGGWMWSMLHGTYAQPVGKPGIALATRQRMWKLCRAIAEGAERPYAPGQAYGAPITADGGNTIYAALQDIVARELRPVSEGGKGSIDAAYVKRVCTLIGEQYKYTSNNLNAAVVLEYGCDPYGVEDSGGCRVSGAGSRPYFEATCGSRIGEALYAAWEAGWRDYEYLLHEQFWDAAHGTWRDRPRTIVRFPATAILSLNPSASKLIAGALRAPRGPSRTERVVAGASTATLAGIGAAILAGLL